ncbi:MAG TPA: Gfo/Idh/MocA family oxidoreductase [Prolixibacteraceae bacterium]|nr:Gfo/Idh/MocA family oxidoreductase [Prolixibacteraceae bacterium]
MAKNWDSTSRRNFIKTSLGGIAALTIIPSTVMSGFGHNAPSDRLNIGAIGVGGVGYQNLLNLENENIVALCDVDTDYAQKSYRRWNRAATYSDFRQMLEKEKSLDAVIIATPDHTHAIAAISAMQLQKHVFVQSPASHSVFAMQRMIETASTYDIVSQVGNRAASGDESRDIAEIIWSGEIGEIKEIHAWTSEPLWQQGLQYPADDMWVPKNLNWDLFLGPTSFIPYHKKYTPFGWRAFWEFGNGALGIKGPSVLEPVFRALKLSAPIQVQASSSNLNMEGVPKSQKIAFDFARRNNLPKLAMPELRLHWYDGGLMPATHETLPDDVLEEYKNGGLFIIGKYATLVCGEGGYNYKIFRNGLQQNVEVEPSVHRVPGGKDGHESDWVRACKEPAQNRLEASASFEGQGALTETILVGAMAVKLQSLHRKLEWDSAQMRFVNINDSETFSVQTKRGFYLQNNVAKIREDYKEYNANRFIAETVRPLSRSGWMQI